MSLLPTITFRGVRASPRLEKLILDRSRKLETYFRPILACRVVIEFLERRHRSGNRYHVRIDLAVPGEAILVTHEASLRAGARNAGVARLPRSKEPDPGHKDARLAVREAFDLARRQLQDHARRQRGAVKVHEAMPRTRVVRIHGRPACRLRLG